MFNFIKTKKYIIAVALVSSSVFSFSVKNVFASTRAVVTSPIHSKDVFAVNVILDTDGKNINVVEGKVVFSGLKNKDIKIKDISVAGSVLSIWTRKPSLSLNDNSVTFSGGSLENFSGSNLNLFKVFVEVDSVGKLQITQADVVGYVDDGSGTKVAYKNSTGVFDILPALSKPIDAEFDTVTNDNEPPSPFVIELMQDKLINNGMKFLSFEAKDIGSGIDRYEVTEGDNKPVVAGSSYVPVNQDDIKNIVVMAYDKAGNVRVETYNATSGLNVKKVISFIFVVLVILVGSFFIIRFAKKNAKHKNK